MLDEAVFASAQTTQQSLEETVHKLEETVDLLNNRLHSLLSDVGEEQAKIKQRVDKIEIRLVIEIIRGFIRVYPDLVVISEYFSSVIPEVHLHSKVWKEVLA